jgi:hypothetical protein
MTIRQSLCILLLLSASNAEAWVLWERLEINESTSKTRRITMRPVNGYATFEDCTYFKETHIPKGLEDWTGPEGKPCYKGEKSTCTWRRMGNDSARHSVTSAESWRDETWTYTCLPDTIDPRGPMK